MRKNIAKLALGLVLSATVLLGGVAAVQASEDTSHACQCETEVRPLIFDDIVFD